MSGEPSKYPVLFSTGWRLRVGRLVYLAAEEEKMKGRKVGQEGKKAKGYISLQLSSSASHLIHPSNLTALSRDYVCYLFALGAGCWVFGLAG